MSARDLLRDLRSSGVGVSAHDGYIDLDAPTGVLTDELIEAVAKAKPRLLKLLDREQRKLEEAERRGLIIKWAREPGWIALHDPTSGEWQGGKVIREYIGAGTLGELAAKTDALRRLRREREGMAWREERESLEALDRALGELDEAAEILARAALYAAGYHRHNRSEWRKKRMDKKRPNTEKQGTVVPARKASVHTKGAEVTRSRIELINELRPLLAQAYEGDEEAPHQIRRALEETPDSAQILSNIVAKRAERILVKKLCGNDLLLREALSLQLEAMRKEVAGTDPTALEQLLAERVIAYWLALQEAEAACAANLGKPTTSQSEYHQRRLDRVHRRFLSSIRALGQIRKLLTPAITQVNLAQQQQVNMIAKRPESDS